MTETDITPLCRDPGEGAVKWLAAHQGWLPILDNASDPADVARW
jgi:hypothetical protein